MSRESRDSSVASMRMPPRDQQRFITVAQRIVGAIAAVRGRTYSPQTGFALYGTTGTHGDYAYARHIANAALRKTYGFTFETGRDHSSLRTAQRSGKTGTDSVVRRWAAPGGPPVPGLLPMVRSTILASR
jgi:hypothetical protein